MWAHRISVAIRWAKWVCDFWKWPLQSLGPCRTSWCAPDVFLEQMSVTTCPWLIFFLSCETLIFTVTLWMCTWLGSSCDVLSRVKELPNERCCCPLFPFLSVTSLSCIHLSWASWGVCVYRKEQSPALLTVNPQGEPLFRVQLVQSSLARCHLIELLAGLCNCLLQCDFL